VTRARAPLNVPPPTVGLLPSDIARAPRARRFPRRRFQLAQQRGSNYAAGCALASLSPPDHRESSVYVARMLRRSMILALLREWHIEPAPLVSRVCDQQQASILAARREVASRGNSYKNECYCSPSLPPSSQPAISPRCRAVFRARLVMRSLNFHPAARARARGWKDHIGVSPSETITRSRVHSRISTRGGGGSACRNRAAPIFLRRLNTPLTRDIIRGRVHIRAQRSRSCRRRRRF
jgi:hypothetical protein